MRVQPENGVLGAGPTRKKGVLGTSKVIKVFFTEAHT